MLTYTSTRDPGWIPGPEPQPASAAVRAARTSALAHEGRGCLIVLRRDRPQLCDRVVERNELDAVTAQRRHRPPPAFVSSVDRGHTHARRQHAVERRGRAPALDVPEHRGPRLESRALLDLVLQPLPDPTEPRVTELVLLARRQLHRVLLGKRPLRGYHDRERASAGVAAAEEPADVLDVEWPLRDQDHVGTAGEPRLKRDPARMTAHHLHHHDAMVRLGCGVKPVDRLGRDLQGSVEPEGDVGGGEVVVDRLRDAEDLDVVLVAEAGGHAQSVLAADRDHPVEVERDHVLLHLGRAVIVLEGIRPRRPENRAATRQDAARRLDRQLVVLVLEWALPAVAEADDRVPVHVDALADDRPDRRVQPRAVPAAGEHPDPHGGYGRRCCVSGCAARTKMPTNRIARKIKKAIVPPNPKP